MLLLLLSRFSCVRLCATPETTAHQAPLEAEGRLFHHSLVVVPESTLCVSKSTWGVRINAFGELDRLLDKWCSSEVLIVEWLFLRWIKARRRALSRKPHVSPRAKVVEAMEFQLSYFRFWKRCCEYAALSMPAHLGNSAVATGLEKVSFHSSSKET